MNPPGDITQLLHRAADGDEAAEAEAMRLTYEELRRLAAIYRRRERADLTLQASDIVQEVCVQLLKGAERFTDSGHFYRTAGRMMRNLLVDHARRHVAQRRGGGDVRVPLDDFLIASRQEADRVIHLDLALARLEKIDPRRARVVELHFFCGLTRPDIARILKIATKTVTRDWNYSKAWLRLEIGDSRKAVSATPDEPGE